MAGPINGKLGYGGDGSPGDIWNTGPGKFSGIYIPNGPFELDQDDYNALVSGTNALLFWNGAAGASAGWGTRGTSGGNFGGNLSSSTSSGMGASGSIWDYCGSGCGRALSWASNFSAGAGDFLSFGATTQFNQWTGAQSLINTNSGAYDAGFFTGVGVVSATGTLSAAKVFAGVDTKIAIHGANHFFPSLGRSLPHLQIMWWLSGVEGSGQNMGSPIRIPLTPWWPFQ